MDAAEAFKKEKKTEKKAHINIKARYILDEKKDKNIPTLDKLHNAKVNSEKATKVFKFCGILIKSKLYIISLT